MTLEEQKKLEMQQQMEQDYKNLLDSLDINFVKNTYIGVTLQEFYNTFRQTLNTGQFVPEKFNDYIRTYIFKSLKKKFKEVNKLVKIRDKNFKKQLKEKYRLLDVKKGE